MIDWYENYYGQLPIKEKPIMLEKDINQEIPFVRPKIYDKK